MPLSIPDIVVRIFSNSGDVTVHYLDSGVPYGVSGIVDKVTVDIILTHCVSFQIPVNEDDPGEHVIVRASFEGCSTTFKMPCYTDIGDLHDHLQSVVGSLRSGNLPPPLVRSVTRIADEIDDS